MRCIIKEDVLSLGLPVTSQGLVYSVLIPGACEIAFVKEDDFAIMIQRGHAIDLPALQWEREVPGRGSDYIKAVEGRMIFRCDYQDDGHGRVWLIPEEEKNENSNDVLLLTSNFSRDSGITLQYTNGAKSVVERCAGGPLFPYHLIHMPAGSSLKSERTGQYPIYAAPTFWRPYRSTQMREMTLVETLVHVYKDGVIRI